MTFEPTPAPEEVHRFSQGARTGNFIGLVLKNAILGLLTLTLYRFWGRTEMRRRLWATTSVMGDPLEYTGTGWELFKGFLISIPIFFLPAAFVFYVGPTILSPELSLGLIFLFYVLVLPLMGVATYLMRRYQLSRTRWRGVRLSLGGSSVGYGFASLWWQILEVITFGWYGPAARMRRAKLLWQSARFGDQPFEFAVGESELARGLYGPFTLAWFGLPLAYLAAAATVLSVVAASIGGAALLDINPEEAANDPAMVAALIIGGIAAIAVALVVWMLCQAPYQAAAMNRTASLLTLDGARFRMKATTFGLLGVMLKAALVTVLSLGLLGPLGGMYIVRYMLERLELVGTPRFAEIGQAEGDTPDQGEGIADAFDLDFGFGVL